MDVKNSVLALKVEERSAGGRHVWTLSVLLGFCLCSQYAAPRSEHVTLRCAAGSWPRCATPASRP